MAATNNRLALITLQTNLRKMGGVANAVIGEPKSGNMSGVVAIIPENGNIPDTTLVTVNENHTVTLRRMENTMQSPEQDVEFRLDQWRAEIQEDILGDFSLGGNVAWLLPTEMPWQYGYVTVEQTLYRFLDVTITYQVHPASVFMA